MSFFDNQNFDEMFHNAIYNSREDVVDAVDVDLDSDEWEDDGQPTHYEEMQDVFGGDDYIEQWEYDSWD